MFDWTHRRAHHVAAEVVVQLEVCRKAVDLEWQLVGHDVVDLLRQLVGVIRLAKVESHLRTPIVVHRTRRIEPEHLRATSESPGGVAQCWEMPRQDWLYGVVEETPAELQA